MRQRKDPKRWFSVTAKDCRWQYFRGSGKGGRKRNKTDSAVRCIHEASGAVGEAEDLRTQSQNKRLAFERMAETNEFKSWLRLKIDAGLDRIDIQEGTGFTRKLSMEEV